MKRIFLSFFVVINFLSAFDKSKTLFPDLIVGKSQFFQVAQDWEVPIPAFFIISSLRDGMKSIDQFSDEELSDFVLLIKDVREGMRKALAIDEVYLFQNEDSEHAFHLWIFPRYSWMEFLGRKIQSVRPLINYAKTNLLDDASILAVEKAAEIMKQWLANSKKEAEHI